MVKRKYRLKHLPNFITILNMVCGILSIIVMIEGGIIPAFYLILIAAVFDFLDGMIARILSTHSPLGKQLDSLADMVSFGIAPALLMFYYLKYSYLIEQPEFAVETASWYEIAILFSPILIALASGFRLAKFNIDQNQSHTFSGLPSPANAILIASTGLVIFSPGHPEGIRQFILNPYILLFATLILSFLLISGIPMFSFKFKDYKFANNKIRYSFLAISVALLIIFKVSGIPLIILAYIFLSIIGWIVKIVMD